MWQSVQSCVAHYGHGAPTFIWSEGGLVVIQDSTEQLAEQPSEQPTAARQYHKR